MSDDRLTAIEKDITDIKNILIIIINLIKEGTEIKDIRKVLDMIFTLEKAITESKKGIRDMLAQLEKEIKQA